MSRYLERQSLDRRAYRSISLGGFGSGFGLRTKRRTSDLIVRANPIFVHCKEINKVAVQMRSKCNLNFKQELSFNSQRQTDRRRKLGVLMKDTCGDDKYLHVMLESTMVLVVHVTMLWS